MITKTNKDKYFEGIGRRKTSTSRVRITSASRSSFIVNDKKAKDYFHTEEERGVILDPILKVEEIDSKWKVEVRVKGGGHHSQAEAVRQGLARALVLYNQELRTPLKSLGFLKRDPRSKERRKAGMAGKARKAKQWSKR